MRRTTAGVVAAVAIASLSGSAARADVISDWNAKACDIVIEAKALPPSANRSLAMVQTAVFEAVNAITKRYPVHDLDLKVPPYGASLEAAVAAANRGVLVALVPLQQAAIDSVYRAAIGQIPESPSKNAGIEVGEKAAAGILARRASDDPGRETYRPTTAPGVYVPTVIPAFPQWPNREPWLMKSPSQFRPGPPPKLTSEIWARDYNEIKAIGCKSCPARTAEQTDIARFWEATGPAIYHGIVRSLADTPGRDITQNARLFAAVTQAADDALIAVFEAKYHYNFWRPITAIRNGDRDDNAATERDSTWLPFIDTPMHPEYPCAHCIISGAVGTVLQADIGTGPMPTLTTTSPTAKDLRRSWSKINDFMQEVANGRIYDGVHFRNSTEVGTAMGKQVGALAVAKYMR